MTAIRVIVDTGRAVAGDVKIAHSVFAMPFALLAAVMAAAPTGLDSLDGPRFAGQATLVVIAMVFARTAAMIANRVFDRRLDAGNPRTAGRAIPSGRLTTRAAVGWLATCSLGFGATAAGFGVLHGNWWPAALAVPVLAWICAYGLFKRFTALCHIWLGASLALSPVAAAIAIDPSTVFAGGLGSVWLLAIMVLCWVAGFDVIYALQDVDVDRRDGLHSMPSRLGVGRALMVARVLHAASLVALFSAYRLDPRFGAVFLAAVAAVTLLLLVEHATVHRWGTTRMSLTFFTLNGVISCVLGAAGIADVLAG